jgi:hypothetical protein
MFVGSSAGGVRSASTAIAQPKQISAHDPDPA